MIAAVCTKMANDYKGIDMTLWKETEGDLGNSRFSSPASTVFFLICRILEYVGNHIAVRDHYPFLSTVLV